MPIERLTAKKTRIADLTEGRWVKNEGMNPNYIVTPAGQKIGRARIIATVVGKFIAEDGNFASVTLDDFSDTIRIKTFKTTKPLDSVEVGQLVETVGKVREWNDEIYVIPDIVRTLDNPNMELLRRLELIKLKNSAPEKDEKKEEKEDSREKEKLRSEILKTMEEAKDGITFTEIMKKLDQPEEKLESVVSELLSEGICYEPSPGKIKKI